MLRSMTLEFKRNRLVRKLNDRNLDIFNDIVEYIELGLLSSIEREEVFQQILDMMLQAQSEGKFVSEVMGNDIEGFCDAIIEESILNKNFFHIYFDYIEGAFQIGIIYFFIISIIEIILGIGDKIIILQRCSTICIILFITVMVIVTPIDIMLKKKKILEKNKKDYSKVVLLILFFTMQMLVYKLSYKIPKSLITYKIPYDNTIFLVTVFIIAFGRDMCYFIKNVYRNFCKKY